MKIGLVAGAIVGMCAVAACGSGGSTAGTSATGTATTASQPSWATALGSGVTVVDPQTVPAGNGSPGAVITGLVEAFNAKKFGAYCRYAEPSQHAECESEASQIVVGDMPSIKNFALGYVAIDGDHAVVGMTGTMCNPLNTPKCASNSDPAAIFATAKSFATLWKNALKNTSSYSLTPCVEIAGKWYIDSTAS
jgi:hypothetical protein